MRMTQACHSHWQKRAVMMAMQGACAACSATFYTADRFKHALTPMYIVIQQRAKKACRRMQAQHANGGKALTRVLQIVCQN